MKTIKVYLDGSPVADADINGTAGAAVNYDMTAENGVLATTFANELAFSGAAYAYIINKLIRSPTGAVDNIAIRIEATCCKDSSGAPLVLFRGLFSRADLAYCEGGNNTCEVSVSALDSSPAASKLDCIRNTIIHARTGQNGQTSNGVDEGRRAVFFGYYDEPRPYSSAFLGLFSALYLIVISTTILLVLDAITRILNFITFGGVPVISLTDSRQFILGLVLKKRYQKAVLINSYLQNACKLCGLQLRAPLFEAGGAYYNLTRLDAPYSEGGRTILETEGNWINFNRPNITFAQLFATFAPLNIGYVVTDTELIFDRIDRLQGDIWLDLTTRGNDILEQCYDPSDTNPPAGEIFRFAEDGSDKVGNEFIRLWSGDIVDYNTPFNPILKGIKQTNLEYGAARFVLDGGVSAVRDIQVNFIWPLATLGSPNLVDNRLMLISQGTATAPKLLLWDEASQIEDATVQRRASTGGNYLYNIPAWLNQNTQGSFGVTGFYDNLLAISDPRRTLRKNFAFRVRFSYICEDLRTIGYGKGIKLVVDGQAVRADVDTVEIDLEKGEITITGKI